MKTVSKRGQNEGTIRRRPDGTWEGRLSLGWKDGKRHRPSFYGKTKTEVSNDIAAARKAFKDGEAVTFERQTVCQFLDHWLETSVKITNRPRTYASYKEICEVYIKPHIGHILVAKLEPQRVQGMLNKLFRDGIIAKNRKESRPLSARTVQYVRAVLRRALGQAVKWGVAPRNVAALADAPRVVHHEVQPLSPDQARCLLAKLRGHPQEALFTVAIAIGLRLGEALGLRWKDVDLQVGTITVNTQLQRDGKEWVLREPKSRSSRRVIALPKPAIDALQEHWLRQEMESKEQAGDKWQHLGLVFTSAVGSPLDKNNVRKLLLRLLKEAGLPTIRFHDLRHTCATLLLAQNVHPRVVMEILGHSQISLTMNTYSHVINEVQQQAAGLMGDILTAKSTPTRTPTRTVYPNRERTSAE